MASARFSMRLEPELRDWLDQEAKRKDRSAGYIATQAIRSLKQEMELKRQLIQQTMQDADRGEFVSEQAMTKWFLSLGTENELPEPEPDVFATKV